MNIEFEKTPTEALATEILEIENKESLELIVKALQFFL